MKFYSQFGEDKWLYENIYKDKKTLSYFIDVGAGDPIKNSNTYFFEKELGWKGICIDADLIQLNKLKKKREIAIGGFAIGNKRETIKIDYHRFPELTRISKNGKNEIKMLKLDDILTVFNFNSSYELLSIDVEGQELEVLKGMSIFPRIIIIEYESHLDGSRENEIKKFLKDKYKEIHKTQSNLIMKRK